MPTQLGTRFNPSYGLHALRAALQPSSPASQPRFNPSYGLHALRAALVHCLCTGYDGFNPSYGLHALRAVRSQSVQSSLGAVSIPHMGCMPYGLRGRLVRQRLAGCFNPSYGLHALRALLHSRDASPGQQQDVSIPHMGCMPYGPGHR